MSENKIQSYAASHVGPRRTVLEDFATTKSIVTVGGLELEVAIVCDGTGDGNLGIEAAKLTAQEIERFLRGSEITEVPRLLITAVKQANRRVFEMPEVGKTTVAIAAVHRDDSLFGRLYIASVGDCYIGLIRNERLIRLNTDHTVGNEAVLEGRVAPTDIQDYKNAFHLTRAIGVEEDIVVDIGIYYNFRDFETAIKYGMNGVQLAEGDTIFVCTDGLIDIDPEEERPYVREDEFIEHALEEDVERATNTILSYALMRAPGDNVSLAMIFIPSPNRKSPSMLQITRLSPMQRLALLMLVLVILGMLGFGGYLVIQNQNQVNARQEAFDRQQRNATATALSITQTFEAIPTLTPTTTVTPRPLLEDNQLGYIDPHPTDQLGLLVIGQDIIAADDLAISFPSRKLTATPNPNPPSEDIATFTPSPTPFDNTEEDAVIYVARNSQLIYSEVDWRDGYIELDLVDKSNIFIQTGEGDFADVVINYADNLTITVSGSCMSVQVNAPNVTIGCFEGRCEYRYQSGSFSRVSQGEIRTLFIDENGINEARSQTEPIDYNFALKYQSLLLNTPGRSALADVNKCIQGWGYLVEPSPTPRGNEIERNLSITQTVTPQVQ